MEACLLNFFSVSSFCLLSFLDYYYKELNNYYREDELIDFSFKDFWIY